MIEHKATQIINTFNKLSNPNMLSTTTQAKVVPPQAGLLTFEDFEDNEEYDKILTAEELRKKAADFISVILLFIIEIAESKTKEERTSPQYVVMCNSVSNRR